MIVSENELKTIKGIKEIDNLEIQVDIEDKRFIDFIRENDIELDIENTEDIYGFVLGKNKLSKGDYFYIGQIIEMDGFAIEEDITKDQYRELLEYLINENT